VAGVPKPKGRVLEAKGETRGKGREESGSDLRGPSAVVGRAFSFAVERRPGVEREGEMGAAKKDGSDVERALQFGSGLRGRRVKAGESPVFVGIK